MKVFCNDCKYHRFIAICKHPSTKHVDNCWAFSSVAYGYGPIINASNDCSMYEPNLLKSLLNIFSANKNKATSKQ